MSIADELIYEEGNEACVYKDSRGFDTIGIGRCVDARVPGAGLTRAERKLLLYKDIGATTTAMASNWPWSVSLSEPRRNVLYQMVFVMGLHEVKTHWHDTLTAIQKGDYATAARHLRSSLWATQAPARVKRLADQLETGVSQYPNGA